MAASYRLISLLHLSLIVLVCSQLTAAAIEGVREVDLNLKGLVYDPFTQKLYGSAANNLLQIDAESGQVLASFPLGTNVTALSLGADHGLWTAISGEHALRRFNLQTLEAEEKIEYFPNAPTFDVAASKSDPQTVVFTTYDTQQGFGATFVIRDGQVLPDIYQRGNYVDLEGNTLFLANSIAMIRMAIGPTGVIIPGFRLTYSAGTFQFQVLGTNLYSSPGEIFEADTLNLIRFLPLGSLIAVAKNETESAAYFFYSNGTGAGQLRRYQHPTGKLTGYAELPGLTPDANTNPFAPLGDTSTRLVSWGTNHLAFFARSKLFLLDTSKLFTPSSDLEVTQAVRNNGIFGEPIDFDITIRNKGPGAALAIVATNRNSSGLVTITNANLTLAPAQPATVQYEVLPPGNSVTFTISVLPTDIAVITNWVDVTSDNESNFADNQSVASSSTIAPKPPVITLNFTPKAMAYNPANDRIYFLENIGVRLLYAGSSLVWSLDAQTLNLAGGFKTAIPFQGTDLLDSASGSVYLAGENVLTRIDPNTLQTAPGATIGRVLYDLVVSSADPDLAFVSDENGSRLYKGGTPLPNGLSYHARAEFSADGGILYAVNQETCNLSTYKVASDGLTLLQTFGAVGCSDFKAVNGFLYFNSGAIVDASSGQKLANSPSFSPPSFVLPRTNGVFDVVTKVSGVWSVRRFDSQTLQELRRVTIDQIDGSPSQIVAAGPNRVAIRASGSGLYLVDLDPSLLGIRIVLGSNGSATVTFDTIPGERYQVERSDNLGTGPWTAVGSSFVADGLTHTENISIDQAKTGFFRLTRLP